MPAGPVVGHAASVDEHTPAEDLPQLYRAVLDTVVRLEHLGDRDFAWKVRRDAVRTYSTRWDDHGRRALERLNREAQLHLAASARAISGPALAAGTEPA